MSERTRSARRALTTIVAATAIGLLVTNPRLRRLLRRWATVLRLSGRSSARAAAHGVRRLAASGEERAELDVAFQLRTAEDVAATLGGMKGAFMKVGQLASFVDDAMPEHVRSALAALQDSAPPMDPALVAGVIRTELGAAPEDVFAHWDPAPLAAASIGQVHRAVLADGTEVAVKVQYPGIDETMAADLAQLDLGRFVAPIMGANLDYDAITAELRARLLDELDYTLEAANQARFAAWYEGHPFVRVPRVVEELSTGRVLVTTLSDGERFAELERRSQAERDLAAETIFRFVHRSISDHLAFNGDPHPGNYLFGKAGEVTFLDFGLVKHLSVAAREMTLDHAHAVLVERDAARSRALQVDFGFYVRDAPLTLEQTFAFDQILWGHALEDRSTTLTSEWASEMVRGYAIKDDVTRDINHWSTIPPDFVILQRITIGLFALLGRLNATANWHAILKELWWEGPVASPMGEQEAAWLADRTGRPPSSG